MQINVGHLDEHGRYDGNYTTIALAGRVRAMVRGLPPQLLRMGG